MIIIRMLIILTEACVLKRTSKTSAETVSNQETYQQRKVLLITNTTNLPHQETY